MNEQFIRQLRDLAETLEEENRQLRAELAAMPDKERIKRVRTIFGLGPQLAKYLLALLARPICSQTFLLDNFSKDESMPGACNVNIVKLRKHLSPYSVKIQNLHSEGWFLTPEDKAKISAILEGQS